MDKLLTIVVPIYKVEPYINKCLDSLIVSSDLMEELEVILVNDGTPDKSAEMSREYVKQYPATFKQIDKENGGHGSAWNVGLRGATGKYVRFLDSDDWFIDLDRLMTELEGCNADLVFNPYVKEYIFENRQEIVDVPSSNGITPIHSHMWGTPQWGLNSTNFWSLTYRASILKPLDPLFAEGVMFDDYILTWAPLIYGRTYLSLDFTVYHYLIGRPGQSMSMTQQRKGAESYVKCFEQYEIVRSRIDTSSIPENYLNFIDRLITGYAGYIFSYMLFFPYSEAYNRMSYLWERYLRNYDNKSKLQRRYQRMPFFLFFFLEKIRNLINRKKNG